MKRSVRRGLALAALLSLSSPALVGCSGKGSGSGAIALVVGGRNNMPKPQLLAKAQDDLRQAFDDRDTLIIVGVAGEPRVRYTEQIKSDCDIGSACDAAFSDFLTKVTSLVGRVHAQTPEADTLGAILTAGRALQDHDGPKRMVVIDNGLQTAGAMPMQYPGALMVDPDQLVQPWTKDGKLKSLNGVDVLLTGLGDTRTPQQPVPGDLRQVLADLWTRVIRAGGGSPDVDNTDLADTAPTPGLPTVTPVSFKSDPPHTVINCPRFREDQVGFVGGKATFRNPAKASAVLQPVADDLRRTGVPAVITGTTALDDGAENSLSKQRAQAVVKVLTELGVSSSKLTAIGVGVHFVGFVPDTDAQGHLIETIAVQNRLVIVQPAGQKC
jgi:OOP family OmpA-OmpF porin